MLCIADVAFCLRGIRRNGWEVQKSSSKDGRRGVLLPDLEGVDAVEEQLAIAARKAGIAELRSASVERFRVDRFKERGA